jgi:hypothetical protein
MNLAELNTKLRALLTPELGTYSNGSLSIWAYGSSNPPPSVSNGLECLIRQVPLGYAKSSSAGQKYKIQEWEIYLKNYKKDLNLSKAIIKIEKSFSVIQVVHMPYSLDTIEQARILIKDPIVFQSF